MSIQNSNRFKQDLKNKQQIGLWLGLANAYCAEIAANAGFDWLLIDAEHAPNDIQSILAQLQAIAAYPSQAVVRPVIGEVHLIKQLLDIGAQTLLIPMVETAQQAQRLVLATRYPPEGIRGVGAALARASKWNTRTDYLHTADQEICLLIQIESKLGVDNLAQILAVEGIDGVFIGPADLSAALGHRGDPAHPEVQSVIIDCIKQIRQSGKAAGILFADEKMARQYLQLGVEFIAVGVDATILSQSLQRLHAKYQQQQASANAEQHSSVY